MSLFPIPTQAQFPAIWHVPYQFEQIMWQIDYRVTIYCLSNKRSQLDARQISTVVTEVSVNSFPFDTIYLTPFLLLRNCVICHPISNERLKQNFSKSIYGNFFNVKCSDFLHNFFYLPESVHEGRSGFEWTLGKRD